MSTAPEHPLQQAANVLQRMKEAASDSPQRLKTIERFETACSHILSGQALIMAKGKLRDTAYFRPGRVLVAESVHAYVTMRQIIEGYESEWTGPKKRTIRGDKEMLLYIDLLNEASGVQPMPRKGGRSYEVIDIISRIPDPSERAILRTEFEEARVAIAQKNIAVETLAKVAAIDLTKLPPKSSLTFILASASNNKFSLNSKEKETFQRLATTVMDAEHLGEMGLVFRGGRVKMDSPPGSELISAEAVALIFSLAEIPLKY